MQKKRKTIVDKKLGLTRLELLIKLVILVTAIIELVLVIVKH